jgi:thiol:disulfide interchange protein DsbA
MKRRIQQLSLLLGLSLIMATAAAGSPENGKQYRVLQQAQPTESGKKIEVTEFFAYYCPHCNALEPLLEAWVKKQGNNIVFKRVHVLYPKLETQQKLYVTLESMGLANAYQMKAFNAYHVERNRLQTDGDILEFVKKVGIDQEKFLNAYNSFSTRTVMSRSAQMMASYQIDSWPTVAVDGRYMTSPYMAIAGMGRVTEQAQNEALLPVLDWLVAKAQKEKASALAAASAKPAAAKK